MRRRYAAGLGGATLGLVLLAPAGAAEAPATEPREPTVRPGAPARAEVLACFPIALVRPSEPGPVPMPRAAPVRPGPVPLPLVATECERR